MIEYHIKMVPFSQHTTIKTEHNYYKQNKVSTYYILKTKEILYIPNL